MARKGNTGPKRSAKSRSGGVNRQLWSTNDRLQLLAYLEWCVQHRRDFESTAIAHLKKVTGKQFSTRGIRDKLKREWVIYGKCDDFEELFSEGLDGLQPLEDDDEAIVQHIVYGLDPVYGGRQTRSASAALAIRSRTLSETRSTRATSTPRRTNSAPRLQPNGSKKSRKKTKQKVKQKRSTRHKGMVLQRLTKRVQRNKKIQPNSARQLTSRNLSVDELATDHDALAVKSEDESELSAPPSPGSSDVALEQLTAIQDSQDEDMIDTSEAQPVPLLEARLRDLEEEIVKLKNHNLRLEGHSFTLTNRLAEAHSELEDYHDRHGGPLIGESVLKEQIIILKARLEAQVLQKREFEGLAIDRLGFQKTSFKEGLKQLFSIIDHTSWMICDYMTIDDSLPQQRSDFDQLGQTWVTSFYDGDLGALLDHSDKAGVSKKKLLATLLTAGVFELVLKPVLPSILTLESPLLDEYRKHILTQDGWRGLQRIDLVAIKSLISDHHIRTTFISEKASWISSLILHTLSFFFPFGKSNVGQDMCHSEEETLVIRDLEETLFQALSLKVDLTLCARQYKFLFFKPGSKFDFKTMQADDSVQEDLAVNGKAIKLCIVPAIYHVPARLQDERSKDITFRISRHYNEKMMEATLDEIESLVLVGKAVVLL